MNASSLTEAGTSTNVSTMETTKASPNFQAIYIVCEIAGICIIAITLYILICMVAYGMKTRKFKLSRRRSDVNGEMVYMAATITVALTIPRYISSQVIFNVLYIKNGVQTCDLLADIGNICYFVAVLGIYTFLWFRQKVIYGHPAMKELAGKCIAVFSWITLLAQTSAGIALTLLFVIPDDFTYDASGCVPNKVSGDVSYKKNSSALVGVLLVTQISLLSLFIYPMAYSNAVQNSGGFSKHSSAEMGDPRDPSRGCSMIACCIASIRNVGKKLSTSSNGRSNIIQKTIWRSVFSAAISMVSDLAAMIFGSVVLSRNVRNRFIYDASLLINVLCVLFTFANYRSILNVFCAGETSSGTDKTSSTVDDSKKHSEKTHSMVVEVPKVEEVKPVARLQSAD